MFTCTRELPWSAEQMFDLVGDIERYPEFLDGWKHARIVRRDGDLAHVEQEFSLAGLTLPMTSRAEFHRPHRLRIAAEDGPVSALDILWDFEPGAGRGCRVRFTLSYGRATLANFILSAIFEKMGPRIVAAFEQRARQIYGAG
jgi:coenzyme Q-binding protein COQ10